MKCRICQNEEGNISFELTEMMYGLRDEFKYFQCSACECIQIVSPPVDMNKYYPGDYYSYTQIKQLKGRVCSNSYSAGVLYREINPWLEK